MFSLGGRLGDLFLESRAIQLHAEHCRMRQEGTLAEIIGSDDVPAP